MSQCQALLKYLETGRSVSPLMALDKWGCFRLAARIRELRNSGHKIATHTVHIGAKKFAAYMLDRA